MTTHGLSSHKLYKVWLSFRHRCTNPLASYYEDYGGRGISVCEEWSDDIKPFYYWAMANGYREGLTLDRTDNDGGYSPENCRWVTMKVQSRNRRSNHMLTLNGKKQTMMDWCDELGFSLWTLTSRKRNGWSDYKTLTTPTNNNCQGLLLTHDGRTQTLPAWARELGIRHLTLYHRIYTSKWSVERALTTPVLRKGQGPPV